MSTFGEYFRVTTYGESHCRSVGCIVDGVPPGMELTEADIQPQMTRRRPGQSALTTPRNEKDRVEIQSGTEFGVTLGTPIGLIVRNEDQRPKDYGNKTMDLYPRPSHADFTYLEKYGVKASSGGGRSSARETIGMSVFGSGRAGRAEGQWLMLFYRTSGSRCNCRKISVAGAWSRDCGLCVIGGIGASFPSHGGTSHTFDKPRVFVSYFQDL